MNDRNGIAHEESHDPAGRRDRQADPMTVAALPHVGIAEVRAAHRRIAPFVHRTPLARSATLDAELGAGVLFKCENLQKVGAFKARGALNAVLSLSDEDAARGVVTHSSGNHGQALAYAASQRAVRCTVVMPETAPAVKLDAVRGYGATVVLCAHAEREQATARIRDEEGSILVHPFNDPAVIAGQGTAALEMLEDVPDLDVIVAPIGGGGLMSGTSVAARSHARHIRLIGAEPERVDDAARSLASGELLPGVENPDTIADGLLTGLGTRTFDIMRAAAVGVVTVTEAAIRNAASFHLFRMKLLVEPSGAVGLAAVRAIADELVGCKVGVIISGGNTDLAWLTG